MPKQPPPEYPPLPAPEINAGPRYLNLAYNDITANCARLAENNQGRVIGEIEFTRIAADGTESIIRVKTGMDFHSDTYRDRIIRTMARRINTIDWETLTEDVCHRTISHCRAGEPEHVIKQDELTFKPTPYLLYPFLPANQPAILVGKKGSLKSTLSQLCAVCLAIGFSDNPYGFRLDRTPKKTLWLDWETDQDTFEQDTLRILTGLSINDPPEIQSNIIYRHCVGALVNQIEIIKSLCLQYNPDLVVVDSIAPASGGDIKDSAAAIAYINALRYLSTTTLSLAHPPKSELLKDITVTGAGQYEDQSRIIWSTGKEQKPQDTVANQLISHIKPFKSALHKPFGLSYDFGDDIIIVNKIKNLDSIPEFLPKLHITEQITSALKKGKLPYKELADIVKSGSLKQTLQYMKNKSIIHYYPADKSWGLAYDGEF